MPKRKIAVSIDETVSQRADELAQELDVSRSRLHELALEAYMKKIEDELLVAQLNKVYGDASVIAEQQALASFNSRALRALLQDDAW